jgi:hypothetical protein
MTDSLFITEPCLSLQLINQVCIAIKVGDMKIEDGKPFYDHFKQEMIRQGKDAAEVRQLLIGYEVFE